MKPSKVATIYARDENGKVLARAKVNNLSSTHVESCKRALLSQVADLVLRRRIDPRECDIDDSEVTELRKRENKQAEKLIPEVDDETFQYESVRRVIENISANIDASTLTCSFDRYMQPEIVAESVDPVPVAAASPKPVSLIRRIFRGLRKEAAAC